MSKVKDQWKELKPQIGSFINELDNLYRGCEDLDETITKAEERGYKRGYADARKEACNTCWQSEWSNRCNGNFSIIKKFLDLSSEDRQVIAHLIELIHKNSMKGN